MRNHDIKIKWSKPYPFQEIFESKDVDDRGLYCISRVFGENESIIYIGKTMSSFRSRLKRHGKHWIDLYKGDKMVRIGVIIDRPFTDRIVSHAECALIFELEPQQNTMAIKSYKYKQEYVVHNVGNRGLLPHKVDMKKQI